MIPIALDAIALPLAVAGRGPEATRRLQALRAGGAHAPLLFSDRPDEDLVRAAGPALRRFLPGRPDLLALRALWIVGLPDDEAVQLATLARSERVLVNVEDRPALCDFHSVAAVRRGDLLSDRRRHVKRRRAAGDGRRCGRRHALQVGRFHAGPTDRRSR